MEHSGSDRILLSSAYFAPVYYYHRLIRANTVFIEKHENFIKQSWRNRCLILAANGPMALVVPVEHGRRPGQKITDIRIAWHTSWQRNQWRSIYSAYKNSPYFDYYADEIYPFFHQKHTFLFDLNFGIHQQITHLLKINKDIGFTEGFEVVEAPFDNLREKISPKISIERFDPGYRQPEYTQVFEDKYPFIPGLSILDLLFCKGPESAGYLL